MEKLKGKEWNVGENALIAKINQEKRLMWQYDKVHNEFEKCAKEHLNNDEIRYRVYREGLTYPQFTEELKSVILPVYQSAENCGFRNWQYEVEK